MIQAAPRPPERIEPGRFREVLGHYPTGVVVLTALSDGRPVGMACNSFTSVSLDPPLISFCVAHTSTTWPQIAEAGAFCVNVLHADQAGLGRRFSARGVDRFAGVDWDTAPGGAPRLGGAVGWLDCRLATVIEAGDHLIVLGEIDALDVANDGPPLVFVRGGFTRPAES